MTAYDMIQLQTPRV